MERQNIKSSKKQVEEQFLEIGEDMAEAVECLVTSYPAYVKVDQLPGGELMDIMNVRQ